MPIQNPGQQSICVSRIDYWYLASSRIYLRIDHQPSYIAEMANCAGGSLSELHAEGQLSKRHATESSIYASLKFLEWQSLYDVERPFQIFINIPEQVKDRRTTNLVFEDRLVMVKDIRGGADNYSLDDYGFMYRKHETKTLDFEDRAMVENQYLPEVESLLRCEVSGVDRVFFFDWRVRASCFTVWSIQKLISYKVEKECPRARGCGDRSKRPNRVAPTCNARSYRWVFRLSAPFVMLTNPLRSKCRSRAQSDTTPACHGSSAPSTGPSQSPEVRSSHMSATVGLLTTPAFGAL